ncbi:MAG: response regulator transcription factor [Acidobacteria bacterium]|nr:response regulator transcription factor [Acidobacteriota bacterium]
MRVLVVEDDPRISDFLERSLTEAAFAVDVVGDGESGLEAAREGLHDAFIVDLTLPGMDGLELIERCREIGVTGPVLILSARRSVDERVEGFRRGGDDYLVKPFAFAELLARLQALLRRSPAPSAPAVRTAVADLEMDLLRRLACRGTRQLVLSPREFDLLEYLCRNAGRVVTRTMVLDRVWGMRSDPQTNVVDVYVHRLRSKVDAPGDRPLIRTIRGVGYVLEE